MSGYCKFYKQKKQVSYDSGATWVDVTPYEYRKGDLYQANSPDCGYVANFNRWVESGTTCSNYNLYKLLVYQTSSDGINWVTTSITKLGDLIEAPSPQCAYDSNIIYNWWLVDGYICDDCNITKALLHTSANTITISGSGEITQSEVVNYKDNVEDVVIQANTTSIGNNCFSGFSNMHFIRIPSTVERIGDYAFKGCSGMTYCEIPHGTTTIGNGAFIDCTSLGTVNLPSSLTSLGYSAFTNCLNFRDTSIPPFITVVPHYCFFNCDGLTVFEFHADIKSIGNFAFGNCNGLIYITLHSTTPPTLSASAFDGANSLAYIYVPAASVNAYKAADGWSSYANIIFPIE